MQAGRAILVRVHPNSSRIHLMLPFAMDAQQGRVSGTKRNPARRLA
jgi:hypothetical protein